MKAVILSGGDSLLETYDESKGDGATVYAVNAAGEYFPHDYFVAMDYPPRFLFEKLGPSADRWPTTRVGVIGRNDIKREGKPPDISTTLPACLFYVLKFHDAVDVYGVDLEGGGLAGRGFVPGRKGSEIRQIDLAMGSARDRVQFFGKFSPN